MIFKNGWSFGGEIVHTTDFGFGNGGNIKVSGITPSGSPIENSIFLSEKLFSRVCEHFEKTAEKFPRVNVDGHFEMKTHETSGKNIKHNLRLIADELSWVS